MGKRQRRKDQKYNIKEPHANDVLCGNGEEVDEHNVHYHYLIKLYKRDYFACAKEQKRMYAQLIVRAIQTLDPPGKFLLKDSTTNLWNDIGERNSLLMVRQALKYADKLDVKGKKSRVNYDSSKRTHMSQETKSSSSGNSSRNSYESPQSDKISRSAKKNRERMMPNVISDAKSNKSSSSQNFTESRKSRSKLSQRRHTEKYAKSTCQDKGNEDKKIKDVEVEDKGIYMNLKDDRDICEDGGGTHLYGECREEDSGYFEKINKLSLDDFVDAANNLSTLFHKTISVKASDIIAPKCISTVPSGDESERCKALSALQKVKFSDRGKKNQALSGDAYNGSADCTGLSGNFANAFAANDLPITMLDSGCAPLGVVPGAFTPRKLTRIIHGSTCGQDGVIINHLVVDD